MMLYNNVLSIPIVIVIVVVFELRQVLEYPYLFDIGFLVRLSCYLISHYQFAYMGSAVQAFLLNYFIFLCSTINSPLTTSVTGANFLKFDLIAAGQIKAIAGTFFGLVILNSDVTITALLMIGLTVSSVGSLYYGYVKYQQTVAANKAKAAAAASAAQKV